MQTLTRPNSQMSPLIEPNEVPIVVAFIECLLKLTRVSDWTPMALGLARKCWNRIGRREQLEDVRGTAMLGLWKAAREYDPGRGTQFSTCAHTYVSNELLHAYEVTPRSVQAAQGDDAWAPQDRNADDPGEFVEEPQADFSSEMLGLLECVDKRARLILERQSVDSSWDAAQHAATTAELAAELGISAGRVNQLRTEGLAVLAHHLGDPEPLRKLRSSPAYRDGAGQGALEFGEAG